MAQSFNHYTSEPNIHDHQPTLASHAHEALHSKTLKVIGIVATGSVLAMNLYNGVTAKAEEKSPFTHRDDVTSVQLDEGARIRHAPTTANEPPITELEAPMTILTPNGVDTHTEFHNGTWISIDAASLGVSDGDGKLWINSQKITTNTDVDSNK